MNTLFAYTYHRTSRRWIANSKVLSMTLECDSKEKMLEAVADGIHSLLQSGRKHGDLDALLEKVCDRHVKVAKKKSPGKNRE